MPRVKYRTTKRVGNRTRGVEVLIGSSTLKRMPQRPEVEGTQVCPACGRNIKVLPTGNFAFHKKHQGSAFKCPGF